MTSDPQADKYAGWSPYNYVKDNPLISYDPNGKWDVKVHTYHDRSKYAFGLAIVTDKNGHEVYSFYVKVTGAGGRNRMVRNSDTPLGVYDIPDKNMWTSGGSRVAYGPNPRLVLNGKSGEIKESGRSAIRIHGGRQEIKNENGEWVPINPPELKDTHGCMRATDGDLANFKSVTDELQAKDSEEHGGQLEVTDDLIQKDGQYTLPEKEKENK